MDALEGHHLRQAFSFARFYTRPMALRIKQLREELGWTQEELASRSKISRSQLAMIERETRPANTLRLNAIADALGVSTEDLFQSDTAERQIVKLLRMMAPEDRDAIVRLAESLAAKNE